MARTLVKQHVHTVKSMPVVEQLRRLTDTHASQVRVQEDFGSQDLADPRPPHGYLHFVMRVVGACIEAIQLSSCGISADIAIPEIAMDKAGPRLSTILLQRAQYAWHDVCDEPLYTRFKILPVAVDLLVQLHGATHKLNEEGHPAWIPLGVLSKIALARINMEIELTSRRDTVLMQLCQLRRELHWIRTLVGHLNEVA